ncbi:hypothetical protein [Salinicola sp. CR57]|uniref:hypothetical protein n=1 Tax=Salinicola sp. CR57 TaxID=1949086 RepID=UPI0018E5668A|nr:hypothetical protein [Salinicola sp. CR57]
MILRKSASICIFMQPGQGLPGIDLTLGMERGQVNEAGQTLERPVINFAYAFQSLIIIKFS